MSEHQEPWKTAYARTVICDRVYVCSGHNRPILDQMNECGVIDKLTDALLAGYTIRFDSTPKTLAASLVMPLEG